MAPSHNKPSSVKSSYPNGPPQQSVSCTAEICSREEAEVQPTSDECSQPNSQDSTDIQQSCQHNLKTTLTGPEYCQPSTQHNEENTCKNTDFIQQMKKSMEIDQKTDFACEMRAKDKMSK